MPARRPVTDEQLQVFFGELDGWPLIEKAKEMVRRFPERFEGISDKSIWQACHMERRRRLISELPPPAKIHPGLAKPLKVQYSDALVIGDVQAPFHSKKTLARAFEVAESWGLKTIVLNGDIHDNYSISAYMSMSRVTLAEELAVLAGLYDMIAERFERIIFVPGNHERRWIKRMEGADDFEGLIGRTSVRMERWPEFRSKLQFTERAWAVMVGTPDGIPWCFSHTARRRKLPGSLARELGLQEGMHYWHGHQHHLSWTFAQNGRFMAVDGGHCMDEERCEYLSREHIPSGKAIQGFGALKDGMPFLFPIKAPEAWWDWALSIGRAA